MNVQLRHGLGDAESDFNFDWDWVTGGGGHSVGGDLAAGAGGDPSLLFPSPGYNITTAPGAELSPADLATEQAAARDWISHAFDPTAASRIAQAVASGAIVVSKGLTSSGAKICPSGYAYPNGQCIQVAGSQQLIPGIPNQTLVIVGIAFLALVMLKGGGRR